MALERLEKTDPFSNRYPHLILLDKEMPMMNGWQFMDAFTNLNRGMQENCKVIMLTSYESKSDVAKGLKYQIEMTSKPLSKEKFADVIQPILDKIFA